MTNFERILLPVTLCIGCMVSANLYASVHDQTTRQTEPFNYVSISDVNRQGEAHFDHKVSHPVVPPERQSLIKKKRQKREKRIRIDRDSKPGVITRSRTKVKPHTVPELDGNVAALALSLLLGLITLRREVRRTE